MNLDKAKLYKVYFRCKINAKIVLGNGEAPDHENVGPLDLHT